MEQESTALESRREKGMTGLRLVLLSTSAGWGGLEMNLLRHARWMAEAGHAVRVVCVAGTSLDRAARETASEANFEDSLEVRNVRKGGRYFNFISAVSWAYGLWGWKATVLWIRDPRDLDTAAWARRLNPRVKLVFHQGMQIPKRKFSPVHLLRYRAVDLWVTPLDWLAKQVVRNTPIRPRDISVIPLGLDDKWFEQPSDSKEAKQNARLEMGIPQDVFVTTLVGRIDPKKGQDVLVRALLELPDHVHAMLVGDPTQDDPTDYFDHLRALIKEHNLKNRVHLRPYLHSPRKAFLATDVAVVCSLQESIGSVTLEAMASGRPVIGADSGGTKALLSENRGWTFNPGNALELAECIERLRTQPELIAPRVKAASLLAKTHRQADVVRRWETVLGAE